MYSLLIQTFPYTKTKGVLKMIQHFTFQKLYEGELAGWRISFYYNREKIDALYHADGEIEVELPKNYELTPKIKKEINELMLFHVYDA